MRRISIFIACLFFSLCLQAQTEVTLRVMSMNIRQGAEYAGGKAEPYAELIMKYNPDVIAIQEVDYKTSRNGGKDWLNEVAMLTGMFPHFCKSISYQGGSFGTALLSKYPFYKSEKTIFRHEQSREDRSTGWIYLQFPEGLKLRVGTIHLSLESSQLTIQHFASVNKAFFAEDTVTPALMIGDYNAASGSDPINYVKNKWQEVIPNMGPTWPADNPNTQLDYVMGYPKAAWECTNYEILAHPELSDHRFIMADLKITIENE